MKIISISLSNFQGIRDMKIDLDGHSAAIYGDNGTGKTTIFNAITWLLFDKPSTGAKNWSPKTRGADGEKHNLEHSVTAVFMLQDGSRITLGKTLREVYKKKRGAATAEYTGNTIDYYIDGVPVKEKEYTAAVAGHCGGEEMMKLLTMPDYFPEAMEWKKRRELLLEICGDVTDETVIESSPELIDLPTYLLKPGTLGQYYTVEEYAKIAKALKADINRQLDTLPDRIDEAQRAIPTDLPSKEVLEARLHAAMQASAESRKIADSVAAGESDTQAVLAAAEAEFSKARADYARETQEAAAGTYSVLADIEKEIRAKEREAEDLRADAAVTRRQAERMTALRESILQEYREAATEKFDANQETCPTCGRRLPEADIATMRADFNQCRSERLAAINARGVETANKTMIAELQAKAAEYEAQAAACSEDVKGLKHRREEIRQELTATVPFETTELAKSITAKIETLRRMAEDEGRGHEAEIAAADARLQECLEREHAIRGQIIQVEAAAKQAQRVQQLEAQEKDLAAKYEDVERGVYLCELFVKTKVAMLTERINSKFRSVSFQLFTEQVNGGLAECCEVLVPSEDGAMVPYATANHAARVNAGLEIVATIAEHFGREMPVVVDNAESVTRLIDTEGQVIRLVVSEADKTLRLEVDE